MRFAASILLALCLCSGLAAADMHENSCGPAGLAGGFSPINGTVDEDIIAAVLGEVSLRFDANITEILNGLELCPPEDLDISVNGCEQVVAGMNYKLWVNMSCNAADGNYTVGVKVEAFQPLPSAANNDTQIEDLELEFVAVDGRIVFPSDDEGEVVDGNGDSLPIGGDDSTLTDDTTTTTTTTTTTGTGTTDGSPTTDTTTTDSTPTSTTTSATTTTDSDDGEAAGEASSLVDGEAGSGY